MIRMIKFSPLVLLLSGLASQGNFNLENLNPNSERYGDFIDPDDYIGDICIVFFGHEY